MDKNMERLKDGIARIISAYSPAEREALADAVIKERDRLYRAKCWSDAVKTQEPIEDPRIAHGDYLYDEMKDRRMEEGQA